MRQGALTDYHHNRRARDDVITGVFALDEEIANMWALRALHRDTVFGVPPAPFLVAKWSRPQAAEGQRWTTSGTSRR